MMSQRVCPPNAPLKHKIRPPGSKSLTNRALLLAAMSRGVSTLDGCLVSEDSDLMRAALRSLGVTVEDLNPSEPWTHCRIQGGGATLGRPSCPTPLQVGTAGTVARFLTAVLAATGAGAEIDGSARMRERPMGQLLDALRSLGAQINAQKTPNALPISLVPQAQVIQGGCIEIDRPASSQFVSALVLAGCVAQSPTIIRLKQGCPALPYVNMTLSIAKAFGANAQWDGKDKLVVTPSPLQGCDLQIEPDASAASYFLALATIYGGQIEIPGLGLNSLQGDAKFHKVLAQMGAITGQDQHLTFARGASSLRGANLDLTDMPDMTLTAAVVALHCKDPTRIRGVEILRHHECDRLAAGANELRKLGAQVTEHEDGLDILPPGAPGNPCPQIQRGVEIETYLDHRMAMAFALAGEVKILDPACTHKTYPRYFEELGNFGMCPEPASRETDPA